MNIIGIILANVQGNPETAISYLYTLTFNMPFTIRKHLSNYLLCVYLRF